MNESKSVPILFAFTIRIRVVFLFIFWDTVKCREIHHLRPPYSETEALENGSVFLLRYTVDP